MLENFNAIHHQKVVVLDNSRNVVKMMSSNLSWKIYIYDENLVDRLTYKKWSQTDRAELETLVKKVDEFISTFLGHLKVYQSMLL